MSENKVIKTLEGKVISDKMDKSIIVAVVRKIKHPVFGKYVKKTTKFHVHDEENMAKVGNVVVICETRPISKTKAWKLLKIVK